MLENTNKITITQYRRAKSLPDDIKIELYQFDAYDFDDEIDDHKDDKKQHQQQHTSSFFDNLVNNIESENDFSPLNKQELQQNQKPNEKYYTEAEMQVIKQRAHEEGYAQAQQDFEKSVHTAILERLTQIPLAIEKLLQQRQEYIIECEQSIVTLTTMIMRKLFPALTRTYGIHEILAIVNDAMPILAGQDKLSITCHPDVQPIIAPIIQDLFQAANLDIEVCYHHNKNMLAGDITLDWNSGGIENNMAATLDHIINASNRVIANLDHINTELKQKHINQLHDIQENLKQSQPASVDTHIDTAHLDTTHANKEDLQPPIVNNDHIANHHEHDDNSKDDIATESGDTSDNNYSEYTDNINTIDEYSDNEPLNHESLNAESLPEDLDTNAL